MAKARWLGASLLFGLLMAGPAWAAPEASDCLKGGQEALGRRDYSQAAQLFAACAQAHPRRAELHYWLGMAHFLAHEPQKAIPAFARCLELDPKHPQALAMLGKLYSFDRQKLEQAYQHLDKALSLRPDLEDARFDMARVYALQGHFDKSFQEFNNLFQSEMRFALYHTELGKILLAMGLIPQARQEFERALILHPGFEPAHRELRSLDKEPPPPGEKAK